MLPPHLGQGLRGCLLKDLLSVSLLPLCQRGRVEGQHLFLLCLQLAAHLGQPQDALGLGRGGASEGRVGGDDSTPQVPALPVGCWSHLLYHLRQSLQGSAALRGEPGQAAMGHSPGLLHLVLELLELPEDAFLLLPYTLVLLFALSEVSRDLALGGCDQVLETGEM